MKINQANVIHYTPSRNVKIYQFVFFVYIVQILMRNKKWKYILMLE